jgi:DNA gyrase subunit B
VEGDSAGGSAKQGRHRKFQAILPLKGKILNVEKARFDKILSSEEIKNIITALGTGAGGEDYDIDRIRYQKVIIMTDADVDGSHIRTLLLTFFYRQMTEIVDKGYLYIAQPPLLKVGKGKSEFYLRDENELNEYILKRISERKVIQSAGDIGPLQDASLFEFVRDLSEYFKLMDRLFQRGIPQDLTEILIREGVSSPEYLMDREKMEHLRGKLMEIGYGMSQLTWQEEKQVFEMLATVPAKKDVIDADLGGERQVIKIRRGLVMSKNYQKVTLLNGKLAQYDFPPFTVSNKDNPETVTTLSNKKELLQHILEESRKGLSIQRYKGLGEMNPDQLWRTTMDPKRRNLLQVKVEDAVEADAIFTVLMGDEVVPRRDFIQSHALEVSVLDI